MHSTPSSPFFLYQVDHVHHLKPLVSQSKNKLATLVVFRAEIRTNHHPNTNDDLMPFTGVDKRKTTSLLGGIFPGHTKFCSRFTEQSFPPLTCGPVPLWHAVLY